MRTALIRRIDRHPVVCMWFYLLLITVAELTTALADPQIGLILHALVLTLVLLHAAAGTNADVRKLAMALSLAPLIRLLSLSLPLPDFPQLYWYPIVSVPLLISSWLVVRQNNVRVRTLGLVPHNLLLQVLIMFGGFGLGMLEYTILKPKGLTQTIGFGSILLPALNLLIFTGFTEEIIFRGLLQSLALPVLRRWALIYVAVLFAVLHIGYLSVNDVIFVFGVGMLFGYIVYWSGSILGVTLAHGLTNIFLFLIIPYITTDTSGKSGQAINWITGAGSLVSVGAIGFLMWQAQQAGRLTVGGPFVFPGWPKLPKRMPQPAELPTIAPIAPAHVTQPVVASAPAAQRVGTPAIPTPASVRAPVTITPMPVAKPALAPVAPTPAPVVQPALAPVAAAAAPITQPAQAEAVQPDQAFVDIYRKLTGDARAPLLHVQLVSRAPAAVSAMLFVPAKRRGAGEIQLYIDGVPSLIPSGEILPAHFHFVEGIVHIGAINAAAPAQPTLGGGWFKRRAVAAPAPQPDMRMIGRMLSKRLTGELATLAEQRPAAFRAFWKEFGAYFDRDSQALDEHRQRMVGTVALEAQRA